MNKEKINWFHKFRVAKKNTTDLISFKQSIYYDDRPIWQRELIDSYINGVLDVRDTRKVPWE